jgi:hypothetical protein
VVQADSEGALVRAQQSDRLSLEETLAAMRRFHSCTPEIAEQICAGYRAGFLGEPADPNGSGRYFISYRHGVLARGRGAHGGAA